MVLALIGFGVQFALLPKSSLLIDAGDAAGLHGAAPAKRADGAHL